MRDRIALLQGDPKADVSRIPAYLSVMKANFEPLVNCVNGARYRLSDAGRRAGSKRYNQQRTRPEDGNRPRRSNSSRAAPHEK
jgi:hypothetical protein